MKSSICAVLKTVLAALVLHGVFTVGIPVLIVRSTVGSSLLEVDIGHARWLGAVLGGFGIHLYLWAAVRLLRRRTSAIPGVAPTVLVTDGWYARTRHPLLFGVILILLGEAVFFSSPWLLAYALGYWLWLTVFVVVREEPELGRTFGDAFAAYRRDVPRWIPRGRHPQQRR